MDRRVDVGEQGRMGVHVPVTGTRVRVGPYWLGVGLLRADGPPGKVVSLVVPGHVPLPLFVVGALPKF